MKRFFLFIIATLTIGIAAQAQSTFTKGTTTLNLGLGIGGTISNSSYSMLLPPLSFSVDYGVVGGLFDGNGSIGVGGYIGGEAYRYKGYDNSLWSRTVIGPRGSLHYQFVDKLDTYASLMLGLKIINWNYHVDSPVGGVKSKDTATEFDWGLHVGARYYLSNNWAIMGELGYGISYFSIGATYRF